MSLLKTKLLKFKYTFAVFLFRRLIILISFIFGVWFIIYPYFKLLSPVPQQLQTCTSVVRHDFNFNDFILFNYTEENMAEIYSNIESGGYREFPNEANQRVAIIVAYRNRTPHLSLFLRNMHYFLQQQNITYGFYIVEQISNQTFNRGKLMNVGFIESLKKQKWDCFIFHDVDHLPENLENYYHCYDQPMQFNSAIDRWNYSVLYNEYYGGVCGMFKDQYEKINGFSNDFWGWGGEDDDIRTRIIEMGYNASRLPKEIGRYKTIVHARDEGNPINPCRFKVLGQTKNRFKNEGLNDTEYKILSMEKKRLYTHMLVDLKETQSKSILRGAHPDFKDC